MPPETTTSCGRPESSFCQFLALGNSGVESRPPLRPTGVFLAVVRRRDRHRRAPGGANVDGLQAVAPHPPGQVAHEGARRVANRGGAHRALQHGGEEGAEELVRDGPQLLFALLRFLCRPGRWSTRLKLQRPPEGSAQVDGNVAKIDLAARGVDGALVHFNAPSWAVRAVMSSTTLPVCPKTGSTSPSLTVHLCLHTALLREIGNAPIVSFLVLDRRLLTVVAVGCSADYHGAACGATQRRARTGAPRLFGQATAPRGDHHMCSQGSALVPVLLDGGWVGTGHRFSLSLCRHSVYCVVVVAGLAAAARSQQSFCRSRPACRQQPFGVFVFSLSRPLPPWGAFAQSSQTFGISSSRTPISRSGGITAPHLHLMMNVNASSFLAAPRFVSLCLPRSVARFFHLA